MEFVNVHGEKVDLNAIAKKHKRPPVAAPSLLRRTTDRQTAKVSDGFIVTGYSIEYIADGKAKHEAEIEKVTQHNRRETQKSAPKFLKMPDLWTEERFMLKNKAKRVRNKPYELEVAAEQCAELARKAGWKQVRVEELMKG